MTALLYGHDRSVAEWVGQRAKQEFSPEFLDASPPLYRAIGVLGSDGTLAGGFVMTSDNPATIELSLAGRGVVYRACWRPVLDYVFTTLGCSRLQSHTRRSNKRVLRQLKLLGFNYEGVARRYYGREDAICFALTTDDLAQFCEKWKL